jgi:glycosyltransferase involved in cell wall biosynthesis
MKIALIGQKGIPAKGGGVERYVEDISTRLVNFEDNKVIVYTRKYYTPESLKDYKGVDLISLPSFKTKNLDTITHSFLATIDAIRRKVDIIHYQSIGPALICWLPKLFGRKIKIISTLQSKDYEHQKWSGFAKFMLKLGEKTMCFFSDEVIVITNQMKSYVEETYKIKTHLITNGANIFKPTEDFNYLKEWNLEKDNYIVAISRIVKHKGLGYLIEAYKNLKTEKKLVIVGEGSFTDHYVQELKEQAKDNENIIFTGNQTGEVLAQLYEGAYLFVQPSESEGLSLALLEAMSRGKAVLVSNIPENLEAISQTGFIFENKNVLDLVEKIKYLLENEFLLKGKGELAQKRIKEFYNWDKVTERINELYKKVVK